MITKSWQRYEQTLREKETRVSVRHFVVMIIFCTFCAYNQTTLSGTIAGATFEQSGNPFIITDNITIPEGKSVTIKEGCVFLFTPFTGIIVDGSLMVEGTLQSPVVFSTVNDNEHNPAAEDSPNPFDWNGILINTTAQKVILKNFIIVYTVYGIKSMKPDFSITNGTFRQNGQYNCTVNESIMPVVADIPFNYGMAQTQKSDSVAITGKNLPTIFAITGAACGIGAVVTSILFYEARSNYPTERDPSKQTEIRSTMITTLAATAALGTITVVLVPSAICIHRKRESSNKKTVLEITPQYRKGPGISLCIRF
jgi:hypothetical protein